MISLAKPNSAGPIIGVVLIFGLAYVVLSCYVASPPSLKESPLIILNKGISLSAFILLTCHFSLGPLRRLNVKVPEGWLNARKAMGMTGFLLALIHALMSLMLFTPAVYGTLFEPDGVPTFLAGLSMLCGMLAVVVLGAYNLSFQTFLREDRAFNRLITSRKFILSGLSLGAAHLLFISYESWLRPAGWNGGLPPVSLVAFVIFCAGFVAHLLGRD